MIIGYKSIFYYVALLLPFRVALWAMLMDYQLCQGKKNNSWAHVALLAMPYIIAIICFNDWFQQVELSKLSYISGLIFTPLFFTFCMLYVSTMSIGMVMEIMSIFAFLTVLIIQTLFHSSLVGFWHKVMMPYYQAAVKLYALNISSSDLNQFLSAAASAMTSNIVIQHLLSPMLAATLIVLFMGRHKQYRQDWLSLRLSWSAFIMVMPLFFLSYSVTLLQQTQLLDLSYLPLATLYGLFEMARFMPAVCGLSLLHHWLCKRYSQRPRMRTIGVVSTSVIFYLFGALFYPICAFLGLIDRVVDLRQSTDSAKS